MATPKPAATITAAVIVALVGKKARRLGDIGETSSDWLTAIHNAGRTKMVTRSQFVEAAAVFDPGRSGRYLARL